MTDTDVKDLLSEVRAQMKKAIEHFEYELSKIRAGRATTSILDGVNAEAYGALTPISQLANNSILDARTISIKP